MSVKDTVITYLSLTSSYSVSSDDFSVKYVIITHKMHRELCALSPETGKYIIISRRYSDYLVFYGARRSESPSKTNSNDR